MATVELVLQCNRRETERVLRRAAERVARGQRIVVFTRMRPRRSGGRRVFLWTVWTRRIHRDLDLENARAVEGFVGEMTIGAAGTAEDAR